MGLARGSPRALRVESLRPWLFAIVAAVLVGLAGLWVYASHPPSQSTPYDPDSILFSSAMVQSTAALTNATHSAWSLVSVVGIASAYPVNPPIGRGDQQSCGSLPSPTLWNTSVLPRTSGRVGPGTAPFWQLTFLNRSSRAWVMVTVVSRHAQVLGPIPAWAPCSQEYGVNNLTNLSGYPSLHPVVDTSEASSVALSQVGSSFLNGHPYAATYYTMGNQPLGIFGWNADDWFVTYTQCGVSGAPIQIPAPQDTVLIDASSGKWFATDLGGFSCMGSRYSLNLSIESSTPSVASMEVCGQGNATLPPTCASPSALSAGLTLPRLITPSGTPVSPSVTLCPVWVRNASECPTPTAGWYVVLSLTTGQWLDSFPNASGSQWVAPNVDLESGDLLTLVVSSGTSTSGDLFSIDGLTALPFVEGNTITV